MPHTFPHKTVTARKPRRCDLCAEPIPVGMSYLQASTIDSDGWTHHHVHAACEALRVADAAIADVHPNVKYFASTITSLNGSSFRSTRNVNFSASPHTI